MISLTTFTILLLLKCLLLISLEWKIRGGGPIFHSMETTQFCFFGLRDGLIDKCLMCHGPVIAPTSFVLQKYIGGSASHGAAKHIPQGFGGCRVFATHFPRMNDRVGVYMILWSNQRGKNIKIKLFFKKMSKANNIVGGWAKKQQNQMKPYICRTFLYRNVPNCSELSHYYALWISQHT